MNKVCYLKTSIGAIYFFCNNVTISLEHVKRSICQRHCFYFTTLVATIHIITSGLWLIQEKLNMFIWAKPLQPCSFKGAFLFHRTNCSKICFKKCCAKFTKVLATTPLFVGECVNVKFRNSNCSYSLTVVNVLEKQLQTFTFAMVTFGITTFSKEFLFQNTYSLNFFCGTVVFWKLFEASNFCNFLFDFNSFMTRPLSYRNQSIDKSMDWFLFDNGLRHKRVRLCHLVFMQFPLFASNC